MIEFKHQHVRLAAVDTCVMDQVLKDIATVLFPPPFDLEYRSADIVRLVRCVMSAAIGRVTLATNVLPFSGPHVRKCESSDRLVYATV